MLPTNPLIDALLTDLYQLTMAYGYWKNGQHEKPAVFELFFRKCPFGGELAVFAGLEQVLRFLEGFRFRQEHLDYLSSLPEFSAKEPEFFEWLRSVDARSVTVWAPREGTVVFPRVPLLSVEGPLAVCQLLETTLLSLVNYASLVTTNAARFRLAAGWDKTLLEFGLRRAQGPDGGVSASYYSYLGGFDASSNVKAGQLFGIPIAGTHAHAFVESFESGFHSAAGPFRDARGSDRDFLGIVDRFRKALGYTATNEGELAAFAAYAMAFPDRFTALVDTYDTLATGVPNFLCVASALFECGYTPRGIRLDSGDLAFLSLRAREMMNRAQTLTGFPLAACRITASNDINEDILWSLTRQAHAIDQFGIGTHLVTCERQPAFGGVYKLVEIAGAPRVKLSENVVKITLPGRKRAYRLFGQEGYALADFMLAVDETEPQPGVPILCCHPFDAEKKVLVSASEVRPLLGVVWEGRRTNGAVSPAETRQWVIHQIQKEIRPDYLRPENPPVYKVAVSQKLLETLRRLIAQESVVKTIS